MRRRPNPWIVIPSVLLGTLAGALGWMVTDISCRQADTGGTLTTCTGWATVISMGSFLTVTIGVALVLVLVYRSFAEWRDADR